jgi:hypothetical protein
VPEDVVRVIEPRRGGAEWLEGIQRVVEHGSWPKLRCGGLSRQNFPSLDEIVDFLTVINDGGASFKATAGLHNAVRHTDSKTEITHHGFLNLLVATARIQAGGDVHEALASTDGTALAEEAGALSDRAQHAARSVFASYGSCSLTDPITDMEALGLL